ncbi:MAG: CpsD/CapB family tyrosine-protein kinase [bacterium]
MRPLFSEKISDNSEQINGSTLGEKILSDKNIDFPLNKEILNLRTALLLAKGEHGVNSLLLAGLESGVGATSIAVALSIAIAWDNVTRVLIIDANFQNPQLDKVFKIPSDKRAGLIRDTSIQNLKCIPYGRLIRAGNRQFDSFMRVLNELESEFDFIIIDSAPLNASPEVMMLSTYFKSMAVVVEAEKTRIPSLQKVIDELKQTKAHILGVVLNRKKNYLPKAIANYL